MIPGLTMPFPGRTTTNRKQIRNQDPRAAQIFLDRAEAGRVVPAPAAEGLHNPVTSKRPEAPRCASSGLLLKPAHRPNLKRWQLSPTIRLLSWLKLVSQKGLLSGASNNHRVTLSSRHASLLSSIDVQSATGFVLRVQRRWEMLPAATRQGPLA